MLQAERLAGMKRADIPFLCQAQTARDTMRCNNSAAWRMLPMNMPLGALLLGALFPALYNNDGLRAWH